MFLDHYETSPWIAAVSAP